jgi:hypothetical protein
MAILQPTKVWLQGLTISGLDQTRHVLKLSVFETICKPYITGTLILRDDNNVINTLGLVGGEPISFSFSGGDGLDYSQTLHILTLDGKPSSNNLRSITYTFQMVGPEYFGDKANMIQKPFQKMTGTSIIESIHSMFMSSSISVPVPSTGMLGDKNSITASSTKPFKAINDIRKIITFGGMSGANLYFRDRYKANMVPVEHLFSGGSSARFVQKNSWGKNWEAIFGGGTNDESNYYAILAASTSTMQGAGRGVQLMAAASQGERKVTDLFSTKKTFDDAISGSGFGGLIASIGGGHGGAQNFPTFDSTKIPKQNVRDTGAERAYLAELSTRPQVTIKVPFQTGVACTAGGGCDIQLIPPMGDLGSTVEAADKVSGPFMIADLCHEISPGEKDVQGTTTMRCIRK